jgi:formamidopyrimidine-DNA glycosylase
MPELPDVEGFRRYLDRYATAKRISEVEVHSADIVRNRSAQGLARALRGRRFAKPQRHGKWLLARTNGPTLLMHFGMTGGLRWVGSPDGPEPHDRVVFRFRGGELRYHNMRKLGGLWLATSERELERVTGPLGPDALEVDRERVEELLAGRRGGLKAALMDQRLIAGIGNELSDEILWQARLAPSRSVGSLDERERRGLFDSMRKVIAESCRHGRIPRKRTWLTSQRGVDDPTCPRCRTGFRRSRAAGRRGYYCPRCQRS